MNDWEEAIISFIKPFETNKDIQAAILTGSYAIGTQNSKSDIDIYIVSSNELDWRERGNLIVYGFLIEYFINPPKQIYKYLDDGIKNGDRVDAYIFHHGKVIFDKTGVINELKERAENDLKKELNDIEETPLQIMKYYIWDF
jgi:predicted nucleotidyltransferase